MRMQAPDGLPCAMTEQIAGGFAQVADGYDAQDREFFGTVGQWLVNEAEVSPGDRVLDLGCGRGAVTIPAARATGPGGEVIAVDPALEMLDHASLRADAEGLVNVTFHQGFAESPGPFTVDRFDRILAGMVIQFLARPGHVVWKWMSLLDLDGVLGFTWTVANDPRWKPAIEAVDAFVPDSKLGFEAFMRRKPFHSIRSVEDMLTSAGYTSVTTETRDVDVTYQTPQEWWVACQFLGPWVAAWRHIPPDRLNTAKENAFKALEPIRAADGSLTRSLTFAATTARLSARPGYDEVPRP